MSFDVQLEAIIRDVVYQLTSVKTKHHLEVGIQALSPEGTSFAILLPKT